MLGAVKRGLQDYSTDSHICTSESIINEAILDSLLIICKKDRDYYVRE